jgi:parvulin-like peptidyl-prolyl isomerase
MNEARRNARAVHAAAATAATSTDESLAGSGFFDASRVNFPRSMLLYVLGALIGLGMAGYGLFTAAGTSTHSIPPEDIALVNQRPILRSDFITQLENETGVTFGQSTKAQQLKVLREMVREELLVQRSVELDYPETDQDTRNALVSAVTQQSTVEVTTTEPSVTQLQDFYEQHKAQYASDGMMTVRNLLLPLAPGVSGAELEARARQAAQALRAGQSPEQVEAQFGMGESRRYELDYYFAAKYRLGDTVFDAVRDLSAGQVSDPISASDGVHVVQMLQNDKPVPLSFERARVQVLSDYKKAAEQRLLEATMQFLRTRSKIMIASDYARDYQP